MWNHIKIEKRQNDNIDFKNNLTYPNRVIVLPISVLEISYLSGIK